MKPAPLLRGPQDLDGHTLLFGRDATPCIVAVDADRHGTARLWRRVDGQVIYEEDRFPNWLLLRDPDLLGDLPIVEIPCEALATRPTVPSTGIGLVHLRGDNAFQYLVLTNRQPDVEQQISDAVQRGTSDGTITAPLGDLMYVRPATEQYLTITGRTYYGGMTYSDVRRLQFDFETTGLGIGLDHIFMVSIKDSAGFAALLDTGTMSEAELLRELVRIIRERDPDVIENHNIFDFDIRCLIKRAEALAVPLPLGRDGTTFRETKDSVKIGAHTNSFHRFSLTGREIVDTLHAARRYGAIHRDFRSAGLKEAAKYFGFAAADREYVPGANIWPVFQVDPDRIRRYCMDDVEEVDGLSRLLLAPSFALASMVPKAFERIATAGTGQGLIEPLLVRAFLAQGHSLPLNHDPASFPGGRTAVFTTGVVQNVVKADVASLYPSIMLADGIAPASDGIGAFLGLLDALTHQRLQHKAAARGEPAGAAAPTDAHAGVEHTAIEKESDRPYHDTLQAAMKVLINSFFGMLGASFALFCDKGAAERVTSRGRQILELLLEELTLRGATLIEADTDGVLFSLPPRADGLPWALDAERTFIDDVARQMPSGIHLEHDGRYQAMYSYLEKNYALLDYPSTPEAGVRPRDPIRLVGASFRSAKLEPYIERFLAEALTLLLQGNIPAIRDQYRATCHALRQRRIPTPDVCVTMPLTKTPQTYAQAKRKEEPYEVFLAARDGPWKPGQRIRYYQARVSKRLLTDGPADYDAEHYVQRLHSVARQRLEKAFQADDLDVLLSESNGLFDPPLEEIRPIRQTRRQLALPEDDPLAAGSLPAPETTSDNIETRRHRHPREYHPQPLGI